MSKENVFFFSFRESFEPQPKITGLRGSTRFDTNRAVQPQKIGRGLKFWILEEEGLYYLCGENKGADQLCCVVFPYAKAVFSHDTAHL